VPNKSVFIKSNRKILKIKEYIFYKTMFIFYKIFNLSTNKFKQYFTKTYTILLHTNRLSFNILPGIIKYFIIHMSNLEHWTQFFRRIKNTHNLYVIREKKYKINNWF